MRGEAAVDQPLIGAAAQALLDLPDHRCQLGHVAASGDYIHANDDLLFARGGELHVVGRPEAAVAHLHHARVGIGGARSGLGLGAVALLGCGHFGQLLQRGSDALFALQGRAQLGRLRVALGLARVRLGLRLDRLHQLAGLAQVFVQAGLAAKRRRPCISANAHAVLRHALQADRTHSGQ